uniref:F-box domain-containing protein n=1 Tax=Steinernema glaseri TaxID=37863 RepID=A0A1I7Z1H1_9BILA
MFRTTDTSLLSHSIIYEVLKNAKDHCKTPMQVSKEWRSLMESILHVKYNMYLAVEERKRCAYYYSDAHEQVGAFAQLDKLQCKRLGELRITNSWGFSREEAYAVDFKEDSPTMRVQFKKLDVVSHHGDLDMLPEIVPTDFEEITMRHSSLGKCFPLPATLKKLDLDDFRLSEPESQERFLSFVQNMTWKEISVFKLSWVRLPKPSEKPLELTVVEAWREADDPQLKLFQSDELQEEEWHMFFEEIQHLGRRIDERTLHIEHKKLKKTLCITIEPASSALDIYRRLHMRCL